MKAFGLTGGIGMGKSAAAELLHRMGIPVIDTDILARQIVEPGQPALTEIRRAFGDSVIGAGEQLLRDELARIVFTDSAAREKLESITHPRIRDLWRTELNRWRREGRNSAVVVIPLLFETGAEEEFDATICIACSAASQRERLALRGWSREEIDRRIAAQLPTSQKMDRANYVVWSEGPLDLVAGQLARIV